MIITATIPTMVSVLIPVGAGGAVVLADVVV
jgi:hypothetical protein